MNFKRSERVSELLRHEISQLILELKNPKIGFVTVTGVRLSDDLADAKVYFSVLGSDEDRARTAAILKKTVPHMRHQLGRKLESLHKVPTITFLLDDTPERAQKVLSILHHLSDERVDVPASPEEGSKEAGRE